MRNRFSHFHVALFLAIYPGLYRRVEFCVCFSRIEMRRRKEKNESPLPRMGNPSSNKDGSTRLSRYSQLQQTFEAIPFPRQQRAGPNVSTTLCWTYVRLLVTLLPPPHNADLPLYRSYLPKP